MKKYSFLLFLFLLLPTGCAKNTATVGKLGITEKDIANRVKVLEVLEPSKANKVTALADLIKADITLGIIHSLGYGINRKDLDDEAKRLDEQFNPESLKKIKNIFGNDTKAYMDTFVAVPFRERVLIQGIFIKSDEIHADRLETAKKLLAEVLKAEKSFDEIAKNMGLEAGKLKVSPKAGLLPYGRIQLAQHIGINSKQTQTILNALKTLKKNQVYPEIIPWMQGYQVFKYLRKEFGYYLIESVMVHKHNFNDWFWEEAAKIPVTIKDKKLKDEFIRATPWADKVNFS